MAFGMDYITNTNSNCFQSHESVQHAMAMKYIHDKDGIECGDWLHISKH
jgi:hypothetical protein